jgi:hypothetical protein
MKTLIKVLMLLLFFITLISCSDKSTNPQDETKSPLDMTWAADTIASPDPTSLQTLMSKMYASSSDNVYIAGHTDGWTQIWHYDGKLWSSIDLISQIGGYSVNGVSGISEKSIWVYGQRGAGNSTTSFVLQYNGSKWIPHDLNGRCRIIAVGGDSENNIWAVGDSGIVFNYNGATWKKDYVKINTSKGMGYFLNGVVVQNNIVYMTADIYNSTRNIHYFIKGNMGNWAIADSMYLENPSSVIKFGNRGLYLSKDGELFSYGLYGLWKYNGTSWDHLINVTTDLIGVYSYNKNYTIAVGGLGYVFFYDGSTWTQLEKFYRADGSQNINDAWSDGKNVYLLGDLVDQWPMKTVVYRGK